MVPFRHCGAISDFFFFKQKTAYEMRISDWSSDVCSSDLPALNEWRIGWIPPADGTAAGATTAQEKLAGIKDGAFAVTGQAQPGGNLHIVGNVPIGFTEKAPAFGPHIVATEKLIMPLFVERSEEHTSELQSLMRISYAVFCLKQKKHKY